MRDLEKTLEEYRTYHRHPKNRLTHFIGVPLIVFSLFILPSWVGIHWIAYGVVVAYYVWVHRLAGAALAFWFLALMLLAREVSLLPVGISVTIFIAAFAVGVFFQLLGHKIEGNRPALMDNAIHNLNGPIFITIEALSMAGILKSKS